MTETGPFYNIYFNWNMDGAVHREEFTSNVALLRFPEQPKTDTYIHEGQAFTAAKAIFSVS